MPARMSSGRSSKIKGTLPGNVPRSLTRAPESARACLAARRYIAPMSHLTREDIERIAHLARLRLSPQEAATMSSDLESILGYVDLLATLDTDHVEPTSHVIPLPTPLREDQPGASCPPETAVANAPAREGFAFAVPKVLEGEDEG